MLCGGKLKRKATDSHDANHWEKTAQQEDQRNNHDGPTPSKQTPQNRQGTQIPQLNVLDPLAGLFGWFHWMCQEYLNKRRDQRRLW
jgi:hypothetical protein